MKLIDADEMLKRLESWNTDDEMDKALYNFTLNRIIEQPTVDSEPVRHGKWIYLDKENKFFRKHIVECSICNNSLDLYAVNGGRGDANYCPNCGAKMEKPE